MTSALIVPSLGADSLASCLESVGRLDPAPDETLVVLSGARSEAEIGCEFPVLRKRHRLGFAAAVNAGFAALSSRADSIAILNDDAFPGPEWLGRLQQALDHDPKLAAVQGTVTDATGERVDGRGIVFDPLGLPTQVDRGRKLGDDAGESRIAAVSATACLFRRQALEQAALSGGSLFDPDYGSYHEDVDLGLRLIRLGWRSAWVGGALVRHLGSATGPSFAWRHPWWVLANRWRALSGNLSEIALMKSSPRLLRGEIRAVNTLSRSNRRAPLVALAVAFSVPALALSGWVRSSPGERLDNLPVLDS